MSDQNADSENENSQLALKTLRQFLEDDGWYPQRVEEKPIFRSGFNGQNARTACFAQIVIEREQFLFYVLAPVKAPEEARPAVAEFITRANYGLRIGNFELDYRDGEVRYKSGLDFEGTLLTPALIKYAIYPAVQTMDRYLPGLMSVIYGNRSPAEAVTDIEKD